MIEFVNDSKVDVEIGITFLTENMSSVTHLNMNSSDNAHPKTKTSYLRSGQLEPEKDEILINMPGEI